MSKYRQFSFPPLFLIWAPPPPQLALPPFFLHTPYSVLRGDLVNNFCKKYLEYEAGTFLATH